MTILPFCTMYLDQQGAQHAHETRAFLTPGNICLAWLGVQMAMWVRLACNS